MPTPLVDYLIRRRLAAASQGPRPDPGRATSEPAGPDPERATSEPAWTDFGGGGGGMNAPFNTIGFNQFAGPIIAPPHAPVAERATSVATRVVTQPAGPSSLGSVAGGNFGRQRFGHFNFGYYGLPVATTTIGNAPDPDRATSTKD